MQFSNVKNVPMIEMQDQLVQIYKGVYFQETTCSQDTCPSSKRRQNNNDEDVIGQKDREAGKHKMKPFMCLILKMHVMSSWRTAKCVI